MSNAFVTFNKNGGTYTKDATGDYIKLADNEVVSALEVEHRYWRNLDTVYLVITGGSDNSYTNNTNSDDSQWQYYYSVDGGVYWLDYHLVDGMIKNLHTLFLIFRTNLIEIMSKHFISRRIS